LLASAKKFADEPIVFIAVNSGNRRSSVESYIRHVKVPWPVIVDTSREFEKRAGLTNEISLRNIIQARIITTSGQILPANFGDVEGSARRALQGAKWSVDGASFPEAIKPAWKAVEFGKFGLASPVITAGLKSKDAATKQAATQLNDFIQQQLKAEAAGAWQLGRQMKLVEAYERFQAIERKYQGYPMPGNVETATNWLESQPVVKNEIAASKILSTAEKQAASPVSSLRSRAIKSLKILLSKYPDTRSAQRAEEILARLGAAPK